MIDKDFMNFGETHELNHFLKKNGKRETEENRDKVIAMGDALKGIAGCRVLRHALMDEYVKVTEVNSTLD